MEYHKQSLLSDQILGLLRSTNPFNSEKKLCLFLNSDLSLNWKEISELIPTEYFLDYNSSGLFTYTFCKKIVEILRPVWMEIEQYVKASISIPKDEDFFTDCSWIRQSRGKLEAIISYKSYETKCLEEVLWLTSVLEYALGNIYYTIAKKQPPHLLRDMLAMPELQNTFGTFPMFFLQIIIGTPNSINLRNIVWHGFPTIDEIDSFYATVILIIVRTFGKQLRELHFEINHRTNAQSYNAQYYFEQINFENIDVFTSEKMFPNSTCRLHKPIWDQILKYYQDENYERGIILLLPQIELLLRKLYGRINGIDIRASVYEYYIILDTFCEEYLPNGGGPNKIYEILSNGVLNAIYDIFIAMDGPRLRDKISHGECNLELLDQTIFQRLLQLSTAVVHSNGAKIAHYESKFHPNSQLVKNIDGISIAIEQLIKVEIPLEIISDEIVPAPKISNCTIGRIKIFFRPIQEVNIVTVLLQITKNHQNIFTNLTNALETRIELFNAKKLHSKRRETLKKLISALPRTYYGLDQVNSLVWSVFSKLQLRNDAYLIDDSQYKKLMKCLKIVLKYVENMAVYLHCDKWRWHEGLIATEDVCKVIKNYHDFCNL